MAGDVLKEEDAISWKQWLMDFEKSYQAFHENYSALLHLHDYVYDKHPELKPEYDRLLREAQKHDAALERFKSIRSTVYSWLQRIGRFVGLGDVGALPLIPIAISVTAASAALILVGKWIKDAFIFSRQLNALQAMEARGVPAKQASDIISKISRGAQMSIFGLNLNVLVVGLVALVLVPPLLNAISSSRRHA